MSAIEDVEANLPLVFTKSRDIWKAMGQWSPTRVRQCLEALHAAGHCERIVRKTPTGIVHLYRKGA